MKCYSKDPRKQRPVTAVMKLPVGLIRLLCGHDKSTLCSEWLPLAALQWDVSYMAGCSKQFHVAIVPPSCQPQQRMDVRTNVPLLLLPVFHFFCFVIVVEEKKTNNSHFMLYRRAIPPLQWFHLKVYYYNGIAWKEIIPFFLFSCIRIGGKYLK